MCDTKCSINIDFILVIIINIIIIISLGCLPL